MLKLKNIIQLETNRDDQQLIFEARYLVNDYFTFDLKVTSKEFSGKSHFCVNCIAIESFLNEIQEMYETLKGEVILQDYDSDGYVKFNTNEKGHLEVSGQVGGTHEKHFVRFNFINDRTSLVNFVKNFNRLLKEARN